MHKKWIEEEVYHRFVKDRKWNGIVLKGEDILVLHQISIHSSMRSPSIHELYRMTYKTGGKERNSNWISNRLTKMVEAGLIERIEERLGNRGQAAGMKYYHYRLNRRGYEVLVSEGIIPKEKVESLLTQSKQKKIPNIHSRSASYLANMIFVELFNQDSNNHYSHVRGSRHNYLGIAANALKTEIYGLIVPDWIFEGDDIVVAIENDTGTQRGDIILKKYRHYKKVAEFFQTIGKTLIVVFAVTDITVMDLAIGHDLKGENRHKRIGSLKDVFPLQNEWPNNLHIYVATAKRVPKLVAKFLSSQEPLEEGYKSVYVPGWFNLTLDRLPSNKEMVEEDLDNVMTPNRNRQLDAGFLFQLRKDGFTQERHLVLWGEEGSVRSYQFIRNNARLTYQYNSNPRQAIPLKVDVIFMDKESADEDIYGNDTYHSVYFRNVEELLKREKTISIQKLISPFKKKEVKIFHKK